MTFSRGDRVDVILDACVQDDGSTRVVFRGVVRPGSRDVPRVEDGARRNIVQTWLGVQHDARVFHVQPDAIPIEVLRTLVMDWTANGSTACAEDLRAVLALHEEKTCRA